MRYLVYSDLQATNGNELCYNQPNVTLQHYRVEKFFNDVAVAYTKYDCDGIIDLGDTTDDRSSIPITTIETLGAGMAKLPDGENFKITGNHEMFLRDASINNRRLFEHKFEVIDKRKIFILDSVSAFFISYPADYAELAQWLEQKIRSTRGPKVLFGHFEVEGAFYQNATAMKGIPKKLLEPFDLVLLGHIHLPQSLTPNIHYVGSPFQQDWGESGQKKRIAIFDTNTNAQQLQWVPMTGYPEYQTIPFDEFKNLPEKLDNENRYKVVLNSHEEAELFFQHPAFGRAIAQYSYDETPSTTEQGSEDSQDWSFEGVCRQYMKTVPPSKVGIDLNEDEMIEMMELVVKG